MKKVEAFLSEDELQLSRDKEEIIHYELEIKRRIEINKLLTEKDGFLIGTLDKNIVLEFLLDYTNIAKIVDIYNETEYKVGLEKVF